MARMGLAAMLLAAIGSWASVARAERCGCCCAADPLQGPTARQLETLMRVGAAVAIASYITGTVYALSQHNAWLAVDAIPLAGPVASVARNPSQDTAPTLLMSAGLQAIGMIIATASGMELLDRRRFIDVGAFAGRDGGGAGVTVRLP